MKVLVVKLSAFGDIIHALPALDDLLACPIITEVHWLIDARYAFVSDAFPSQVKVTSVALKGDHPIKAAWRAIKQLRKEKFDLIIDLQGLIKSAVVARAIGSPVYGFDRKYLPEQPNGLLTTPVQFHPDETHVVQWYRRIVAGALKKGPAQVPSTPLEYVPPHIPITDEMIRHKAAILQELGLQPRSFVLLNMGGGYPTKRLPDKTWQQIATQIAVIGLTPMLIWGSSTERERADAIAGGDQRIRIMPRRLDTLPLCVLLSESHALISADTGLLHLAAALGTATISFWGPTQPEQLGPLGTTDRLLIAPVDCINCRRRSCNDFICMPKITPESVLIELKNSRE